MLSVMCVHQLEHLQSRMANKLIMCMLPHHTCLKQSEINSTLHKCSVCQFGSQGPRDPWVLSPLNIASLIWVATQTVWGLPASHDSYRQESKKDHKSAVILVLLKGQLYKLGYFWHLNRLVMLLTIIAHSLCQFINWSSDIPDEKGISDKKSYSKPPDVLDQKAWMSGLKTTSCVGSEDCMDDTPIQ